jgi:hypothetical protein
MPSDPVLISPPPRVLVWAAIIVLLAAHCAVGQEPPGGGQPHDTLCNIAGVVVRAGTGKPFTFKAVCPSPSWAYAQNVPSRWVSFKAQQIVRIYQVSSERRNLIRESQELIARSADGSLYLRESPVASTLWSRGSLIDAHTGKAYGLDYEHQCATVLDHASFTRPPLLPPGGETHGHIASENSLGTRMIGGIPCIGFKYRARLLTRQDGSQVSLLDGTMGKETWEIRVAPSLNYQVLEEIRPAVPYFDNIGPFVPGVGKTAFEVQGRIVIEKRIMGTIQANREPDSDLFRIPAGFRILVPGPWDTPPRPLY